MKKIILSIILLCSLKNLFAQAPNIQWQKLLGGSADDMPTCIIQTKDGGYLAVGHTESSDGDVTGHNGYMDAWIVKLSKSGDLIWKKLLGGSADEEAITAIQTSDGGYLIAGETESWDGDFTGANPVPTQYSTIIPAGWIIKLEPEILSTTCNPSAAPNIKWKLYTQHFQAVVSIIQTLDGGYVFTGYNYQQEVVIEKLANDATLQAGVSPSTLWMNYFGGSDLDFGRCIRQTSDGGFILVGATYSYNGYVSGNHGNRRDGWVIKLSSDDPLHPNQAPNMVWQRCLGGSENDEANYVEQTSDGGYIIGLATESIDGDLAGGVNAQGYTSRGSGWVVKLSPDNTLTAGLAPTIQWQKGLGLDINNSSSWLGYGDHRGVTCVKQTKDGGYILIGLNTRYNGSWGINGQAVIKFASDAGLSIGTVPAIDWSRVYGGSSFANSTSGMSISVIENAEGGYVFAGLTNAQDGDLLGTQLHGGNNRYDFWIASLDNSPLLQISSIGGCNVCVNSTLQLTSNQTGGIWESNDNTIATVNSSGLVIGIAVGMVTIKYTLNGKSVSIVIQVYPSITVDPITGDLNIFCQSRQLYCATPGGNWSSSNPNFHVNKSGFVTYTGTNNTDQTTITYTISNGLCSASSSVIVNYAVGSPHPYGPISGNTQICIGSTSLLSKGGAVSWISSDPTVAIVDNTGLVTAVGSGTATITCTYWWLCANNTESVTVTIVSPPTLTISGSLYLCNQPDAAVTLTASPSTTANYEWFNTAVPTSLQNSLSPSFTVSSITGFDDYYVTATFANGCISKSNTVHISSANPPQVNIPASSDICLGATIDLIGTNTTGNLIWNWLSMSPAVVSIQNPSFNGIAKGETVGNGTVVRYSVQNRFGCSTSGSTIVNVLSLPSVANILGNSNVCINKLITPAYTCSTSGGAWSVNGPNSISSSGILTTGNVIGLATVVYTVTNGANGCTNVATKNITIEAPISVPVITGPSSVCVGSNIKLNNTITGGVWNSTTGRATINATTGVLTGTSQGIATINYGVTNSCGTFYSPNFIVTVNPIPAVPSINFAPGTTGVSCGGGYKSNNTFTLVGSPSGGVWSASGAFAITTSGVVTTSSSPGSGSVTYTVTVNGCSSSRSLNASVVNCIPRGSSEAPTTDKFSYTIFPNPAKNKFTIKTENLIGFGEVIVTDLLGKQHIKQTIGMGNNDVNISNLSKGIYLITVIQNNERKVEKLIVE